MKKKITVITGQRKTGKTAIAKEMVKDKKAVWIVDLDPCHSFNYSDVEKDTEVIVIDDAINIQQLEYVLWDNITINKKMKAPIRIERPEIIIIFDYIDLEELKKYESRISLVIATGNSGNKKMPEEKFIVPIEFDLENQFQLFLKKISLDKRLTDERTIDLMRLTFMSANSQMMTSLLHDIRKFPESEAETVNNIIKSMATQINDFMEKRTQMQAKPAKPIKKGRNTPCICGSGKKYKNCCYLLSSNPIPNN